VIRQKVLYYNTTFLELIKTINLSLLPDSSSFDDFHTDDLRRYAPAIALIPNEKEKKSVANIVIFILTSWLSFIKHGTEQ
jgi:hypothetical protein